MLYHKNMNKNNMMYKSIKDNIYSKIEILKDEKSGHIYYFLLCSNK